MARNRIQWSEQEQMMAGAYANIASSFQYIAQYMKNHLKTVQNGGGVVTEGDMEEIFQQLSDMINKNLHNVSQMRVKITTDNITSPKIATNKNNSNWVSTASNGSPVQLESKQPQKIRISESELKQIVTESVKKVLNEIGDTPRGQYALGALAARDDARQLYMPQDAYKKRNKGYDNGRYSTYSKAVMTANNPENQFDADGQFSQGYSDYYDKEKERLEREYPNGHNDSVASSRGSRLRH